MAATGKQFGKDAEQAVKSWAIWHQAQLEHTIHAGGESDIQPSREASPVESRNDVLRFLDEMKQRDVAPFALGRMRPFQLDVIAVLVGFANADRKFENPSNLWPKLFRHGAFEAYHEKINLTEDETLLLAEASAYLDDPDSFPLREKLEKRTGKLLNLHPGFSSRCCG